MTPYRLLFLDFETYYDDVYSLKNMSPANYILDPRFEAILLAVKFDNEPTQIIDGPDISKFLGTVDPSKTIVIAFNALFDSAILAWRYAFIPHLTLCTMRMGVALRGHLLSSHSLAKVGACLGVGTKGTEIENVRGLHRQDIINAGLFTNFAKYAANDNEMNADIFYALAPEFPASERRVMDRVLRCTLQPEFLIDQVMLQQHLADLETEKADLLAQAGVIDPGQLRSTPKFAELLQSRGIEIETKISATGNEIPAFAKTDEFMERLQENPDPVVAALAAARLGVRSTIEQTRGARILSIANLDWSCYRAGNHMGDLIGVDGPPLMPIPLAYSGAHTHRLSGDWKINMQNLPAGRGKLKSKLRKALIAPPGYKVIVADLAQIECRINAWICKETNLLEQFRQKKDPYSILASGIFGFTVDKKVHLLERFIGKSGVLGLGFQCGATKFYNMVLRSARAMGMNMWPLLNVWIPDLAQKSVDVYRAQNRAIVTTWFMLDRVLQGPWCGNGIARFGPVEIGHGYVLLPNGMKMQYKVACTDPTQGLSYTYGGKTRPIYGGKFLENIVQALARIVLMNAALRLWDRGYHFKLQAHDELAFIVSDDAVDEAKRVIHEELIRPPSWALDLPLDAEVNSGASYGDAK